MNHWLKQLCFIFSTLISLCLGQKIAYAQAILFQGAQTLTDSGAGQVNSRGANAVVHNPANTIYSKKLELYLDVTYLNVAYTYAHPKYEPVTLNVTAPPVNIGASYRPISRLSFGLLFTPKGDGSSTQSISNLPQQLPVGDGTEYGLYNVEAGGGGNQVAAGMAARFGSAFALGGSVIYNGESNTLTVYDTLNPTIPSIQMENSVSYFQFILGARAEVLNRRLALASSYRTSAEKKYAGTINAGILTNNQTQNFEGVGLAPSVFAMGAESRLNMFSLFGEYRREFYSALNSVYQSGVPGDTKRNNFLDTNIFIGGGRVNLGSLHQFSASIGSYSDNVGYGEPPVPGATSSTTDQGERGVSFGNFENIARIVFSGSYRLRLPGRGYMLAGGMYQTGEKDVPQGYPAEGLYTLKVMSLTVGGAYGF